MPSIYVSMELVPAYQTIANNSRSMLVYLISAGDSVLEPNATGFLFCIITEPNPMPLAPTLSTVSFVLSKWTKTGQEVMTDLSLSNASSCGVSHTNAVSFLVSCEIGP